MRWPFAEVLRRDIVADWVAAGAVSADPPSFFPSQSDAVQNPSENDVNEFQAHALYLRTPEVLYEGDKVINVVSGVRVASRFVERDHKRCLFPAVAFRAVGLGTQCIAVLLHNGTLIVIDLVALQIICSHQVAIPGEFRDKSGHARSNVMDYLGASSALHTSQEVYRIFVACGSDDGSNNTCFVHVYDFVRNSNEIEFQTTIELPESAVRAHAASDGSLWITSRHSGLLLYESSRGRIWKRVGRLPMLPDASGWLRGVGPLTYGADSDRVALDTVAVVAEHTIVIARKIDVIYGNTTLSTVRLPDRIASVFNTGTRIFLAGANGSVWTLCIQDSKCVPVSLPALTLGPPPSMPASFWVNDTEAAWLNSAKEMVVDCSIVEHRRVQRRQLLLRRKGSLTLLEHVLPVTIESQFAVPPSTVARMMWLPDLRLLFVVSRGSFHRRTIVFKTTNDDLVFPESALVLNEEVLAAHFWAPDNTLLVATPNRVFAYSLATGRFPTEPAGHVSLGGTIVAAAGSQGAMTCVVGFTRLIAVTTMLAILEQAECPPSLPPREWLENPKDGMRVTVDAGIVDIETPNHHKMWDLSGDGFAPVHLAGFIDGKAVLYGLKLWLADARRVVPLRLPPVSPGSPDYIEAACVVGSRIFAIVDSQLIAVTPTNGQWITTPSPMVVGRKEFRVHSVNGSTLIIPTQRLALLSFRRSIAAYDLKKLASQHIDDPTSSSTAPMTAWRFVAHDKKAYDYVLSSVSDGIDRRNVSRDRKSPEVRLSLKLPRIPVSSQAPHMGLDEPLPSTKPHIIWTCGNHVYFAMGSLLQRVTLHSSPEVNEFRGPVVVDLHAEVLAGAEVDKWCVVVTKLALVVIDTENWMESAHITDTLQWDSTHLRYGGPDNVHPAAMGRCLVSGITRSGISAVLTALKYSLGTLVIAWVITASGHLERVSSRELDGDLELVQLQPTNLSGELSALAVFEDGTVMAVSLDTLASPPSPLLG